MTQQPEEWRSVVGWEGLYEVSSMGRVRSLDRVIAGGLRGHDYVKQGRVLIPYRQPKSGYLVVSLSNGTKHVVRVHTLVLEAFVGPRPDGLEACHGPNGADDNSRGNLRWDTSSAKSLDTVAQGMHNHANKTHCLRRHEFTPENTYIGKNGGRICKKCRRGHDQKRSPRRRDARATT
jgi:hypothetical protein